MPFPAIKANISTALHFLVHIERRGGHRYLAQILRVHSFNPDLDRYELESLYVREGPAAACAAARPEGKRP
jgi:hypothetical protein